MYISMAQFADFIGLIGVLLLLSTYFAISMDLLSTKNFLYQLLNLIAAILLLFSLYFHWNTPSVVIEITWIVISLVGMIRILFLKSKYPPNSE